MRREVTRQAAKGDLGAHMIINPDAVRDPYPAYEQIRGQGRMPRLLRRAAHAGERAGPAARAARRGRDLAARAGRAAVAAVDRPAGPQPDPQAGHPLVQRQGDLLAARAHRTDRGAAARGPGDPGRHRPAHRRHLRLRLTAAGHRHHRDARRPGGDAGEVPGVGRGRRLLPRHGPGLRDVPPLRARHRRAHRLDGRALRAAAPGAQRLHPVLTGRRLRRGGGPAHPRRAAVAGDAAARRRVRDDGQPHRQRHPAAADPPRRARPAAGRPGAVAERRRRGPALRLPRPADRPRRRPRHRGVRVPGQAGRAGAHPPRGREPRPGRVPRPRPVRRRARGRGPARGVQPGDPLLPGCGAGEDGGRGRAAGAVRPLPRPARRRPGRAARDPGAARLPDAAGPPGRRPGPRRRLSSGPVGGAGDRRRHQADDRHPDHEVDHRGGDADGPGLLGEDQRGHRGQRGEQPGDPAEVGHRARHRDQQQVREPGRRQPGDRGPDREALRRGPAVERLGDGRGQVRDLQQDLQDQQPHQGDQRGDHRRRHTSGPQPTGVHPAAGTRPGGLPAHLSGAVVGLGHRRTPPVADGPCAASVRRRAAVTTRAG
ncbi:hypothetical protein L7F22_000103 [Adiantum nelumboides]|nr:hypothetical protein [Adiantum nelumboides]